MSERPKWRATESLPCIDVRELPITNSKATFLLSWDRWGLEARVVLSEFWPRELKQTRELRVWVLRDHSEMLYVAIPIKLNKKFKQWSLTCPECRRGTLLKLYVDIEPRRVGCSRCLRLMSQSKLKKDVRVARAKRDPEAFVASRDHMKSPRARYETARTLVKAMLSSLVGKRRK